MDLLTASCLLDSDLLLELLAHLLSGNTDEGCLELEAARRLEGNVNLHLRFGVNDALLMVEFETLIQNFLNLSCLHLAQVLVSCLHHQFNV